MWSAGRARQEPSAPGIDIRVNAERVDLPFAQLPIALLTVLINSALLSYVLWDTIDHRYILAWLAAILAVGLGRVVLLRAYRQRMPSASPRTWGMLFCIGAGANGLVWGASAVMLYPSENITLQVFLAFVLGGMTAGATASSAAYVSAFLAFAVPALVPIVVRMIGTGDRVHLVMGVMLALFGVAMAQIARTGGQRLVDSIRLRFKNEALAEELEAASNHLTELNRDLETRVAERTADLIEANRVKDEFLATVSHELRTPLTAVLGWAQLMRMRELSAGQRMHAVEAIERNALAQSKLVEDLLDISRIRAHHPNIELATMDPAAVVAAAIEAIRPVMDTRRLQLEVHVDRTAKSIIGDAARIQQIIGNLLSNAAKFTPRGGRVMVDLKYTEQWLEIIVSDTGEGMSPDFLPHAFDRFRQADTGSTRARGGLGLGLAISRQLAELHGGTLEVHSEGRGRGSTFTLRLPRTPAPPPAAEHVDRSALPVES